MSIFSCAFLGLLFAGTPFFLVSRSASPIRVEISEGIVEGSLALDGAVQVFPTRSRPPGSGAGAPPDPSNSGPGC